VSEERSEVLAKLAQLGLMLGSIPKRQGDSLLSWLEGCAVVCSWCGKVVGAMRGDLEPILLDDSAGWVLDRREPVLPGLIICGPAGCDQGPHYTNPIACCDRCELAILNSSKRWQPCAAPADYRQFAAGL
jgi:hypothetical protein